MSQGAQRDANTARCCSKNRTTTSSIGALSC